MEDLRFKKIFFYLTLLFLAVAVVFIISANYFFPFIKPRSVIKVGVLHSLTGTMAISEKPVVDAVLLAIDEINARGGILGMRLVPVVADGRSDPDVFRDEARRLITQEHVAVIFGCWTSASRKNVETVIDQYDSLLFYPLQYEGLEEAKNVVYLGSTVNQQLIPALKWSCDNLGKKIFLVGSDYVFPRVANEVAKSAVPYFNAVVVGEEYIPLGGKDFSGIAQRIRQSGADVVLNTLNGDSNIAFFTALNDAKILSTQVKVMSLSISENEIKGLPAGIALDSIYACWSYFASLDTPESRLFVNKFKQQYGNEYIVTDPMEAAYAGVYLWRQAVEESGDYTQIPNILSHLRHLTLAAPGGVFSIADNGHAFKSVRIGQANVRGEFDIVWSFPRRIYPDPYPNFRLKSQWEDFLQSIYRCYGNAWSKK